MKKKAIALLLGCTLFIFENAGFASDSTSVVPEYTGQVCNVGNNAVCSAVTDEMMKELVKQAVYAVGTRVLNKYAPTNNLVPAQTSVPLLVPATTTTTSATVQATTPTVTTVTTPQVTTVTVPAATTTTTTTSSPTEDMIILQ